MTGSLEKHLDAAYRATVTIALAMAASVLMYAGVVELLRRMVSVAETPAPPETVALLRHLFRGLALVTFLALAWLATRAPPLEGDPYARLVRLRSRTLVGLALADSIAIYGLVLFLLGRDPIDFYGFFVVSMLSFIVAFPRRGRWEDAVTHP